jgi:VacB/RNase II family 3'-5' exoribonuclease
VNPHAGHNRDVLKAIARRAMAARGLLADFSAAAIAETAMIRGPAIERDRSVRDLRHLPWASIDNDDSRDLDQLSVADPAAGGVKILVAIADVDAVVRNGSAIDEHARHNTTSVYTPAEVFPMLPEKLSTDLTSLADQQERLAIVIEMAIGEDGSVGRSDVYQALVSNHAKLAYNSVAAWLDGPGPAPSRVSAVPGLDQQLRLQDRIAQTLKARRHEHGALSLETIEPQAVFDGDALTDVRTDEKNRAKALIEDFMIAANGVTARYLEQKGLPSLRRVLRSPERWPRIVELAAHLGERLPAAPDARALEEFLAKRKRDDPERFPDLSLSVVKLLGRGEYVVDHPGRPEPGHFGLAVQDYTHATAPNRRFPDLVTQRLLKAAMVGQSAPYDANELDALARHCTDQEDNASKVERQVRKSMLALLLQPRVGQVFEGLVTGAADKGTWVRIRHPAAEGKLVRGFDGLDVGDHVRVTLISTDVERGFIDFARADARRS